MIRCLGFELMEHLLYIYEDDTIPMIATNTAQS
jgi:hypothetical protein